MKSIIRCLVTVALVVAASSASAQPAPAGSAAAPTGSAATPAGSTEGSAAAPAGSAAAPAGSAAAPTAGEASGSAAAPTPGATTPPAPGGAAGVAWYDVLANKPIEESGTFWMPKSVNQAADDSDLMFYSVLALSVFF